MNFGILTREGSGPSAQAIEFDIPSNPCPPGDSESPSARSLRSGR